MRQRPHRFTPAQVRIVQDMLRRLGLPDTTPVVIGGGPAASIAERQANGVEPDGGARAAMQR